MISSFRSPHVYSDCFAIEVDQSDCLGPGGSRICDTDQANSGDLFEVFFGKTIDWQK